MAYLITKDRLNGFYTKKTAVGHTGPDTAREDILARLANGEGTPFRLMADFNPENEQDARFVDYEGVFIEDAENEYWNGNPVLQPVDDFGALHYGCSNIQYKNARGEWEVL